METVVWQRVLITLIVAAVAWRLVRTHLVFCTSLGVGIAVVVSSLCDSPVTAAAALLVIPTAAASIGVLVEAVSTHDDRRQWRVERRYAKQYTCSSCGHRFRSIQSAGCCPRCDAPFTRMRTHRR